MWHGDNWGRFKLGKFYPDSFTVEWTVYSSDPMIGYPYHYGNAIGINDTIKVRVYFDNMTETDYPLASVSPESWFYPEIFDPNADVFTSSPIADTSDFGYRFEHWIKMMNNVITSKPDTIYSRSTLKTGRGTTYGIIYSIWGLSPGTYRVILKSTEDLPTNIMLQLSTHYNYFTMTKGRVLLDTLNSYSNIALHALFRKEFTLFDSYVDSIFNRNSRSLIGWALRYHGYAAQADTTNAITACDSVQYLVSTGEDPAIPDSVDMTPVHWVWLDQWGVDYRHYKYRMVNPEESRRSWGL